MSTIVNDVVYDGFSFKDNGLVLTDVGHLTLAKRTNQIEDLDGQTGGVLVQSKLGTKPISLVGFYDGDTPDDAQNMYDTLAQMLNRQERPLIIPHAGGERKYTATPENSVIQEPQGLNRLNFSFDFVVPKGYAVSDTPVVLVDSVVTTSTATIPVSVIGTEKARPFITLTFNSLTGGTSATVTLRNGKDFIGLTWTRTVTAADVITIDSENFQIYINGVLTAPDGRMPTWDAGSGTIYYSDTMTARSVHIYGTYQPKNL